MQRMPSILANPPLVRSRFRIEDQRDERSFLDLFSFLSLSSLRRVGRVKQEGWRAEVEGERERGGEEELISYREASRKRRRGARGLSEKKERVKNTFARDFL